jgi:hypothetical protein
LQELLVVCCKVSLSRLLLQRASANLRLRTLQRSLLCTRAKTSNLLTSLHPTSKISRLNTLLALCCLDSLTISL